MLKLTSLTDRDAVTSLSRLLEEASIWHSVDVIQNTDWESNEYGSITYLVWIHEEDEAKARSLEVSTQKSIAPVPLVDPVDNFVKTTFPCGLTQKIPYINFPGVTFVIAILCSILYLFDSKTTPDATVREVSPTAFSPLRKALIFDYSKHMAITDMSLEHQGTNLSPQVLPPHDQVVSPLQNHSLLWQGVYPHLVDRLHVEKSDVIPTQMTTFHSLKHVASSIISGQLWRLITPSLLHENAISLLFGLFWFTILGITVETRLPRAKYVTLLVTSAILSNSAQHLMSGPFFMGIIGTTCALFGYAFQRQRFAPWERFRLSKALGAAFLFSIFFPLLLAFISFFVENRYSGQLCCGFSNTAHVVGLLTGIVFGTFMAVTHEKQIDVV